MKKLTFSFLVVVAIVMCLMFAFIVINNQFISMEDFQKRNETCFRLGVGLNEVIADNGTIIVDSCYCYFERVAEGDIVSECVCDCAIPDIPFMQCVGFEGCYADNYTCRCRYGIGFADSQ
jgi:hypothetical protein